MTAAEPSPLRGVAYPFEAIVLWRWVDAPQDAAVLAFVREYAGADAGREGMRSSLTMDDLYTLVTFAQRQALAALRDQDPDAARAAFDALSAIDIDRLDGRDVVMAANLAGYAAQRVGLAPEEVTEGPCVRAAEVVGDIIEEAITEEVDLPGDWGYREVVTANGPVLIESDGPPASDDLLTRVFAVAELVTADGRYFVDGIEDADGVPSAWVGDDQETTEAVRRLRGCASVRGELPDIGAHFLLVYLAEARTERDAWVIAEAARRLSHNTSTQLGIAAGTRCAVVVARSSSAGQPPIEDPASLARFEEPLSTLLQSPVD